MRRGLRRSMLSGRVVLRSLGKEGVGGEEYGEGWI
jgi:hypothetical protein